MPDNKIVQLHKTENGRLDTTVNVYPKVLANGCIINAEGNPIQVQEKLIAGTNISQIILGGLTHDILGGTSINLDSTLLNFFYPVGTVYTFKGNKATLTPTSNGGYICPIQRIGGTWQLIEDTFLYAATPDEYGASGGSNDAIVVKHNHEILESGSHKHITEHTVTTNTKLTDKITEENTKLLDSNIAFKSDNSGNPIVFAANEKESNAGYKYPIYYEKDYTDLTAAAVGGFAGNYATTRINFKNSHKHITDVNGTHNHTLNDCGVDGTGKNMPKYETVLAWVRID